MALDLKRQEPHASPCVLITVEISHRSTNIQPLMPAVYTSVTFKTQLTYDTLCIPIDILGIEDAFVTLLEIMKAFIEVKISMCLNFIGRAGNTQHSWYRC